MEPHGSTIEKRSRAASSSSSSTLRRSSASRRSITTVWQRVSAPRPVRVMPVSGCHSRRSGSRTVSGRLTSPSRIRPGRVRFQSTRAPAGRVVVAAAVSRAASERCATRLSHPTTGRSARPTAGSKRWSATTTWSFVRSTAGRPKLSVPTVLKAMGMTRSRSSGHQTRRSSRRIACGRGTAGWSTVSSHRPPIKCNPGSCRSSMSSRATPSISTSLAFFTSTRRRS